MSLTLRLEEKSDYRRVEEVTREAFWNFYAPGANEHFLVHSLRGSSDFIPELDIVAVEGNEIVGNIIYSRSSVTATDGKIYEFITVGPISVLPSHQNKGIGKAMIEYTANLARELGYRAIILYGYPAYYSRLGFKPSLLYKISNGSGRYPASLQVLELYPGALDGISGKFAESSVFEESETKPEELAEFEATFPPKEKAHTPSQDNFARQIKEYLDEPIQLIT
jgi:GNAT superfamily N-acetyltransferase